MTVASIVPPIHARRRPCPERRPIRPLPAAALLLVWGAIGSAGAGEIPALPQAPLPAISTGVTPILPGPTLVAPSLAARSGFHFGSGDRAARPALSFHLAPAVGLAAAAAPVGRGANLSEELIGIMEREALRYRRRNVLPAFDIPGAQAEHEESDTFLAEERSRQAGTILTRSLKRTAQLQLERSLRSSDVLGRLLDRSWEFGGRGGTAPAAEAGPRDPGAPDHEDGRASRPSHTSSFRFRLDAHPRFIVDTGLFGGRARIELPLRDEAMRLAFERPVGSRGRAILSAGLRPNGTDSASLTFSFGF